MDLETAAQPFQKFFYFTGLSNFDTTRTSSEPKDIKKCCKTIFIIFSRILLFTILILQFYDIYVKAKVKIYKPGGIYLFCDGIIIIIHAFYALVSCKKHIKLFAKVYEINLISTNKLSTKIDYNLFKKKLFRSMLKIYAPVLVTTLATLTTKPKIHSGIFNVGIIVWLIVKGFLLLHIIFFAELLKHLLAHLVNGMKLNAKSIISVNENFLKRYKNRYSSVNGQIDEYCQVKIMHFKLWELSVKINKYLGWNYFLVMLSISFHLTTSIYATLVLAIFNNVDQSIIRKYC